MRLKYQCLVLDHDDTVTDSTAVIHYPAYLDAMRQMRPGEFCQVDAAHAVHADIGNQYIRPVFLYKFQRVPPVERRSNYFHMVVVPPDGTPDPFQNSSIRSSSGDSPSSRNVSSSGSGRNEAEKAWAQIIT